MRSFPLLLSALLLGVVATPRTLRAGDKAQPHTDKDVKLATERFEKDFGADDLDKRIRILRWYGLYRHKTVLKKLRDVYLKDKHVELQAAAAEGLGNQLQDPKRAAGYLLQGLDKYEKYATRENPEDKEELLNELEANVLVKSLESLGTLGVKPDKNGWKTIKGFIDHAHDRVAIAMLQWCGATKEWRSLPVILDWFNFYPDGYSWSGGSTSVDTGAAGNKDAKAAKSKWHAKYGGRARKARPEAHAAMRKALEEITGHKFEKPEELKAWMDENKALLKKNGV